jgi:hypothetical protein
MSAEGCTQLGMIGPRPSATVREDSEQSTLPATSIEGRHDGGKMLTGFKTFLLRGNVVDLAALS